MPDRPVRERQGRGWTCRWLRVGLVLLATGVLGVPLPAQTGRPVVYVVQVAGVIDLGLAPFVARVLEEAAGAAATAVILDINTFGGRVDAAVLIRDALLQAPVRTIAFVNKRAISAGALITLAAETIVMADGGTIGAAMPVEMGLPGTSAQPVAEKTVSYMRKEFRATALASAPAKRDAAEGCAHSAASPPAHAPHAAAARGGVARDVGASYGVAPRPPPARDCASGQPAGSAPRHGPHDDPRGLPCARTTRATSVKPLGRAGVFTDTWGS